MARKGIKIWVLTKDVDGNDFNYDDLYNHHINHLIEKRNNITTHEKLTAALNKEEIEYTITSLSEKKDKQTLVNKYFHLIHVILRRLGENNGTTLNATILKKLYGDDYLRMLVVLENIGLISRGNQFIIGSSAKTIFYIGKYEYELQRTLNFYFIGREKILFKELEELNDDPGIKFLQIEDKIRFKNKYNKALRKLKIDEDAAIDFIEQANLLPTKRNYYLNAVNWYSMPKKIKKIDENGRIYSLLTMTPRQLKPFTNIKAQLDIKNSHPLLLVKLLVDYYQIPRQFLDILYDAIDKNGQSDLIKLIWEGKEIKFNLSNNRLNHIPINGVPTDVLFYIILCSRGQFWDYFKEEQQFSDIPRFKIKIDMFTEVFYAKDRYIQHKEFAKAFKLIYPSVFKFIAHYRSHKIESDFSNLARELMHIESGLFHKIIYEINKIDMKIDIANIHDALIIFNTMKFNITIKQIKDIINDQYHKYGLHPIIDHEEYTLNHKSELKIKYSNDYTIINNFINDMNEIKDDINIKQHDTINNLLNDYYNYKIDIIINNNLPYIITSNH